MQEGAEGRWKKCTKEHRKGCQYKLREGTTSPKESLFAYEFYIAHEITTVRQLSLEETQQLCKIMLHRALQSLGMYKARAAPGHHVLNTGC